MSRKNNRQPDLTPFDRYRIPPKQNGFSPEAENSE